MAKVNKGLRDKPRSLIPNDAYLSNYDRIFSKGKAKKNESKGKTKE